MDLRNSTYRASIALERLIDFLSICHFTSEVCSPIKFHFLTFSTFLASANLKKFTKETLMNRIETYTRIFFGAKEKCAKVFSNWVQKITTDLTSLTGLFDIWYSTMWKFTNFPATLMFSEINFGWFQKVKNCRFNHFGGLEFWFFEKFHIWKCQNFPKIQNSLLLKLSK